jgi:putative transposase
MDYRRVWHQGCTYFFTVNLFFSAKVTTCWFVTSKTYGQTVKEVKSRHPFRIQGWVVLPEHLHCVIELPPDDADYATRLMLIKIWFSQALSKTERRSVIRVKRRERGIYPRAQVAAAILGAFNKGRSRLTGAPELYPL